MPTELREIDKVNVTIAGPFNPSIFQPFWLAKHGLVPEDEANKATVTVIHPDVARISVGPFVLLVDRNRAILEVEDLSYLAPLRDLVSGIAQLLPHVPVQAIGFNRIMHFKATKGELDQLGFALAPRPPWSGLLEDSEMRILVMWGKRDGVDARVQIQVEGSRKLAGLGLVVSANEEHRVGDVSTLLDVRDILIEHFDDAVANNLRIGEGLAQMMRKQP